ncbi:MAG: hypothetical protein P8Z68_11510 [Kineosporiaceae bacterium]
MTREDVDALRGRRLLRPRPASADGSRSSGTPDRPSGVEDRPSGATDRPADSVTRPTGSAMRRVNFSANVDGPWSHRSQADLAGELVRLTRYTARVRTPGLDCAPESLSPVEAFVHGAAAAAMWTVGLTSRAPIGTRPLALSNKTITEQREAAGRRADAPGRARANVAAGVAAWLDWLTGKRPEMDYPAL